MFKQFRSLFLTVLSMALFGCSRELVAELDIGLLKEPATICWLEISTSKWGKLQELKPVQSVILYPPDSGSWAVLLTGKTALP